MIAIIGDTQNTLWLERAFLRRERNEREREMLMQHLLQADFELLIHLGDMVAHGSSPGAWREFDRLFAPFFAKGISFLPLLGNHDYWGNAQRRRAHLQSRFPELADRPHRAMQCGTLGVIAIDSNISKHSRAAWARQADWFENTLADYENDATVTNVIVCSHHPPFTNSAVLKRAHYLERRFLPAFFASRKTCAFISGHVHGFERFSINDKAFIVSGGGGGPRLPLKKTERRQYADLFSSEAARPFHYLLLDAQADRVRVDLMGVEKAGVHVRLMDSFEIACARARRD